MEFIKPCEGRVTSPFGRDVLYGQVRHHHGIDWAEGGTVKIVASADGIVSKSYTSSSYGEVVFILHNINGQEFESVYAHMRSGTRKVGVGARVKQGQLLGYMGSTGVSTGQHLHFELHKGRWNIDKSNAVNPLDFIGKNLSGKQYINLHKHMEEWNHYPVDKPPIKDKYAHNIPLNPMKFRGLSYLIEQKGDEANTYIIKTGQFGLRKIYAPRDRDSSITSYPVYK